MDTAAIRLAVVLTRPCFCHLRDDFLNSFWNIVRSVEGGWGHPGVLTQIVPQSPDTNSHWPEWLSWGDGGDPKVVDRNGWQIDRFRSWLSVTLGVLSGPWRSSTFPAFSFPRRCCMRREDPTNVGFSLGSVMLQSRQIDLYQSRCLSNHPADGKTIRPNHADDVRQI